MAAPWRNNLDKSKQIIFYAVVRRGVTLKKFTRQVETKIFEGVRGRGGTVKKYPRHVETKFF
jgi:hypothetical protein